MSADRLSSDMSVRPVDRQLLVILEHYCTNENCKHETGDGEATRSVGKDSDRGVRMLKGFLHSHNNWKFLYMLDDSIYSHLKYNLVTMHVWANNC